MQFQGLGDLRHRCSTWGTRRCCISIYGSAGTGVPRGSGDSLKSLVSYEYTAHEQERQGDGEY
jgi:hypothetical protein